MLREPSAQTRTAHFTQPALTLTPTQRLTRQPAVLFVRKCGTADPIAHAALWATYQGTSSNVVINCWASVSDAAAQNCGFHKPGPSGSR